MGFPIMLLVLGVISFTAVAAVVPLQKIYTPQVNHNHDNLENVNFRLRANQNSYDHGNRDQPPHVGINQPALRGEHRVPPDLNSRVTTATSSYSADLYTYVPSDFTWYGSYTQGYTFFDYYSMGTSSLCIWGDAGSGGRGFESTFTITGDSQIQISYYASSLCADPGLFIFPTSKASYWDWYPSSGRIQFAINCGQPCLYGEVSSNCASTGSLATGQWYTLVLLHIPSSSATYAYVYSGFNVNTGKHSPIASVFITEYYYSSSPLRVGINADNEDGYTNFAKLRMDYGYDLSSDDATDDGGTANDDSSDDDDGSYNDDGSSIETISSYSSDLLYSLPSEMVWYGGYGLSYSFSTYYSGINSINIYGDAGNDGTGRGLESTFYVSGDFIVRVSFYMADTCVDPGISIFPSQSGWVQASHVGRIQASLLCGTSYLYGQSTYSMSYLSLFIGYWYTMVLSHSPSLSSTTVSYYQGADVDPSTASPLGSTTLYEYYPSNTPLHIGIAADTDSYYLYCQFAYLRVNSGLVVSTNAPTKSPTRPPTTVSTSFASFYASLYYSFPSNMVWYGGGSLSYKFTLYYTSIYSLQISGDAGTGARGAETTTQFYGDMTVRVTFYMDTQCTDPGLSIFPASGSNYWNWGTYYGRIQAAVDCGTPALYGQTASQTGSSNVLPPGYWYTIVLIHKPSNYLTAVSYYRGYDIDPSSASGDALIATLTIYEYYPSSSYLRVGLAADPDESNAFCQFAELRVSPGGVVESGGSTTPTAAPTKAPYVADLLSFIPSDMAWYSSSGTSYAFGDFCGTGIYSFAIYGDATDGSRGLETTVTRSGDFSVRVSFYMYTLCTDPALTIFTSQSYWYWGTKSGRIQLAVNCGVPVLYGTTATDVSTTYLASGYWYTMVLSHSASTMKTKAFFYQGYDIDPTTVTSISSANADISEANRPAPEEGGNDAVTKSAVSANLKTTVKPLSGTLVASLSIPESFAASKSLGVGINADTDSYYSYCQFAYLKVSDGATTGGSTVDDDDSTGTISIAGFAPSTSALSVTVIIIIVVVVVGAVCIGVGAWIFFALCRGSKSSVRPHSNSYPDFSPAPSAPPAPSSAYTALPAGGASIIPSNMPVPVPVYSQPQPAPLINPVEVPMTQTYMQPVQQPYQASSYGTSQYQIPVATAVPVMAMPTTTNFSSPYASLPMNTAPASNVYPSNGGSMGVPSGYAPVNIGGSGAYGGYNVEMVPVNESPRGDVL